MKQRLLLIIAGCLFISLPVAGQINIQQIQQAEGETLFPAQPLCVTPMNVANLTQLGNYNSANVRQTRDPGLSSGNQAYTLQQGEQNELEALQSGGGNSLVHFQLGYLSYEAITSLMGQVNLSPELTFGLPGSPDFLSEGTGNTLSSVQTGQFNNLMAIQAGNNNAIAAEQMGDYNALFILQQGNSNQVDNYTQQNYSGSVVYDSVVQLGENLSLSSLLPASSKTYGNAFYQEGSDLSLSLNSTLLNTVGGFKISQTGTGMHITVDQSYFP